MNYVVKAVLAAAGLAAAQEALKRSKVVTPQRAHDFNVKYQRAKLLFSPLKEINLNNPFSFFESSMNLGMNMVFNSASGYEPTMQIHDDPEYIKILEKYGADEREGACIRELRLHKMNWIMSNAITYLCINNNGEDRLSETKKIILATDEEVRNFKSLEQQLGRDGIAGRQLGGILLSDDDHPGECLVVVCVCDSPSAYGPIAVSGQELQSYMRKNPYNGPWGWMRIERVETRMVTFMWPGTLERAKIAKNKAQRFFWRDGSILIDGSFKMEIQPNKPTESHTDMMIEEKGKRTLNEYQEGLRILLPRSANLVEEEFFGDYRSHFPRWGQITRLKRPHSVLITGVPGCGKTTMINKFVRDECEGRAMFFESKALETISSENYFSLMEIYGPDVVVYEDIDKSSYDFGPKMWLFDQKLYPRLTFSTMNNPERVDRALIRSGRLGDQVLKVTKPDGAEAIRMIVNLAKRDGLNMDHITKDVIDFGVKVMHKHNVASVEKMLKIASDFGPDAVLKPLAGDITYSLEEEF